MNNNFSSIKPLISVVVPVFNVEKYLFRCISSILNQTYDNLEIILVDDGSTDSSSYICDEFCKNDIRIKALHKANGGLSSARNLGIDASKGEYLAFVDSDDWISEDMIEHMVGLMNAKKADIVSVSYTLTNDENQNVSEKYNAFVMDREQAIEFFLDSGMKSRVSDYPVCIKLIKRELFNDVRFPIGVLYEDYTTNVLLLKKCKRYVKSSKVCYFYFQGSQSIVRSQFKIKDLQLISQSQKVCDLVQDENETIQLIAKQKLCRSYLSLLLKIAIYGFSDEIDKEKCKKIAGYLTKNLRKEWKILFNSHMPISRKLLLIVLCVDYRPLCLIRKVVK